MPPVDRNKPIRAKSSESEYSLMEFMRSYKDDAACLDWLWRKRFAPDGHTADCPECDKPRRFHRVKDRPSYDCDTCGHHLHPTAGTIFEKSSTSLHLWFYAMYIMASTRCGVSAKQLERELGVTYKTAWRMFNKIRNDLMVQDDDVTLAGEVEADETFVGGKQRESERRALRAKGIKYPGPYGKPRTVVFAMVERGGKVRADVIGSSRGYELTGKVSTHVLPGSIVYTDDWSGYNRLNKRGYTHKRINHSERIYVEGNVHTQTVEGFFSLVKNGLRGVYHSVSAKWLQGYLNEYAWRYNHRDDGRAMFETLLLRSAVRP
jgi:transposase-like protein